MTKRGLLITNGLLWAIASFNILKKGIPALMQDHRWPVAVMAAVIAAGFFMMFKSVSGKYAARVTALEGDRFPIYMFMSPKGYLVIGIMMSMGIGFSLIPGMPQSFFASFYPGLGFGLLSGAIRFFAKA